MSKADITNAEVTILVDVDGEVCAVKMNKDELDTVSFIVKRAIKELIKTGRKQEELNMFLLPKLFKE